MFHSMNNLQKNIYYYSAGQSLQIKHVRLNFVPHTWQHEKIEQGIYQCSASRAKKDLSLK